MHHQPAELSLVALDALAAHIAVLDRKGVILGVNRAWQRFADDNAGETCAYYVGINYLDVCAHAARGGDCSYAKSFAEGLRAVLSGEREEFALEYPCSSPQQSRWFMARVTRCTPGSTACAVVAHEDITDRKRAEDLLRGVLDALPVGVWLTDREGRIAQANPAGERIWSGARYVPPDQYGVYQGWYLHSGRAIAAEDWAAARALRSGEAIIDESVRIRCFDGSEKVILNSAIPLRGADGRIESVIIVNQDISALHAAEVDLRRAKIDLENANAGLQRALELEHDAARTDELTGLHNRRQFFELATPLLETARRYDKPLTAAMLDLDHFKTINDRYGHAQGDRVLQHAARILHSHLRASDVLARYGGEEFVLLLPETDADAALALADRIRQTIAAQVLDSEAGPIALTLSIGLASLENHNDTLNTLLQRADQALYAAKSAGRNRCVSYRASIGP